MIGFFIVAGLLVAGALLFVVPPLLAKRTRSGDVSHGATNLAIYRDQLKELDAELASGAIERLQYDNAKREIERRVLEEVEEANEASADSGNAKWTLAVAVAVAIPVVAIPLYLLLGNPQALNPENLTAKNQGNHAVTPEMIAQMVTQLQQRLASNPDDVEGWSMLAKTTAALGRFDESVKAYGELTRRIPPDAQILADYADTLAMSRGRSLQGEPEALILQALKVDPRNVKALALAGTIAFQKEDFAGAAAHWKTILEVVPPDSDFAKRIANSVADAEAKAGGKVAAAPAKQAAAGAAAGATISGALEIAPAALKAMAPTDTVFIFARAANGPKMPLAIVRLQVKDLPANFKLDESMAMAPGMSIAKFPELVVGARVSKTGNATPSPGDWESELVPTTAGASGLKLVVSRQL